MEILHVCGNETEDGGWVRGWRSLSLPPQVFAVVRKNGILWGGASQGGITDWCTVFVYDFDTFFLWGEGGPCVLLYLYPHLF